MADGSMMTVPGPFTWHVLLTTWQRNDAWDVLVVLALVGYLVALGAAPRGALGTLAWLRVSSFVLGLVVLVTSLNSAIETYSHVLFWVHMVQHLLLIMVVPALLIVGHPVTLLVAATRGTARHRLVTVLRSGPVSLITRPLVGLAAYTVIIVGTHLTSFMQQMLTHAWLHQLEHGLYLVGGLWFLLPILGDEPIRWRPHYLVRLALLFIAMAPDTIVGIVLLQTNDEPFPAYAAMHRNWGPSLVKDIQTGGGIMWVFGDGLMMLFIVAVMTAYLSHSASNPTAGSWLEAARRRALASNLGISDDEAMNKESSSIDDSDAVLDAYNAMLRRLNEGGNGGTRRPR